MLKRNGLLAALFAALLPAAAVSQVTPEQIARIEESKARYKALATTLVQKDAVAAWLTERAPSQRSQPALADRSPKVQKSLASAAKSLIDVRNAKDLAAATTALDDVEKALMKARAALHEADAQRAKAAGKKQPPPGKHDTE